jgi:flagellar assembly protein FliH
MAVEPLQIEPELDSAVGEVMARAKREARAIIEQAEMQAEQIRQAARDEGRATGLEEGRQQGRQAVEQLWDALRRRLQEPLDLIDSTRHYLTRLTDESTVALAAALSLTVFSRLKLERLDVIAQYIQELAASVDQEKVTVFLDPTWSPRLQALQDALTSAVSSVTVSIDDSLQAGVMRAEGPAAGALGGPLLSLKAILQEVLE